MGFNSGFKGLKYSRMLCCVDQHIVIDITKTPTAFYFRIKQRIAGLLEPADEGGTQSRQPDVSADLNPPTVTLL